MSGREQFLSSRFLRRLDWNEADDGRVIVLRPRFGEGRMGRRLAVLFGLGDYRIRLDEIGTLVWRRCDGSHRGSEIAEELRREFGSRIEPAEERLNRFVDQMLRARMIEAAPPDSTG